MNNISKKILEGKSARKSVLTEGQFSWMTQDSHTQIGSMDQNRINVTMFDDKGNSYNEPAYDGYGVFGGMDYFELLYDMNSGSVPAGLTDTEDKRQAGLDLAYRDSPHVVVSDGSVKYPALIQDPTKFDLKTHNFSISPDSDPNQGWSTEEEDDDDRGYTRDEEGGGDY